jgi:CBS-domain-containing membrane protein
MKRKVISIPASATIREAADLVIAHHIGQLPVVDERDGLIGIIDLQDLLSLELPDSFNLLADVDFVHDFGAVETTRPTPAELSQTIMALARTATSVAETCGLLRAYALMLKHDLHDLPVVSESGQLVGIASRVDIGAAILSLWNNPAPTMP